MSVNRSVNSAGRPRKSDVDKRKQLHISVYTEDIERLEQLTDNRSQFVRNNIAKAWAEQQDGEVTFSFTMPKWLVKEILEIAERQLPTDQAAAVQVLANSLLTDEPSDEIYDDLSDENLPDHLPDDHLPDDVAEERGCDGNVQNENLTKEVPSVEFGHRNGTSAS